MSLSSLDLDILQALNQFSRASGTFDQLVLFLSRSQLLKGGVLVTLAWWVWFKPGASPARCREQMVSTLLAGLAALAVARLLALTLPLRLRPLHQDGLAFTLPQGVPPTTLDGWSSFPSDHAVLFYALSMGLWLVSRRVGVFAFAYTTVFIALPRVYLGLHYPTDILAGAAVGIAIVLLGQAVVLPTQGLKRLTAWSSSRPQYFYPALFLLTYQIADMFNGARALIGVGLAALQGRLA